jgi:hypothetical protein
VASSCEQLLLVAHRAGVIDHEQQIDLVDGFVPDLLHVQIAGVRFDRANWT